MIIRKTGKIIDNLYIAGSPDVPVYLLDGENPAIFDAGFSFLGERYIEDIKTVLGQREPSYCFLSHSHFDHCGAVAMLKASFPSMKVVSSKNAKKNLGRPNALKLIKMLSRESEYLADKLGLESVPQDSFKPFEVDIIAAQGDIFEISHGVTVRVIETPGHTRDCLTYYIPEKRILFPSESAGVPDDTGYIWSMFLVDYDMYLDSIKKLRTLDIDIICFGHYLVYTDDDAREYINRSISQCERFVKQVENFLVVEKGDLRLVRDRIKKVEYDNKTGIVQPEPAYLLSLEAIINVVKRKMKQDVL